MANWDRVTGRGRVLDRRGRSTALGGGLGVGGLAIVLLLTYLSGGDVLGTLLQLGVNQPVNPNEAEQAEFEGQDPYEQFTAAVLGSADDYWTGQLTAINRIYEPPELVLFRGQTQSACGDAVSVVGPHYCPIDQTIYLDEAFLSDLMSRLNGSSGDVAEAYVIAHEVGHHVQNELGWLTFASSNQVSVETELQADCLAGLWLGSLESGVLEEGEIREALSAATAVGDDNIQQQTAGQQQPESWTHGSSEQRVGAFLTGYRGEELASCQ